MRAWSWLAILSIVLGCGQPMDHLDAAAPRDSGPDGARDAGSTMQDASGERDAGRDAGSDAAMDASRVDATTISDGGAADASADDASLDGGAMTEDDSGVDAAVECTPGTLDCTSAPGCETSASDPASCGACGLSCNWGVCGDGGCDPVAIESGADMTCVLRVSGEVRCWGDAPGPALVSGAVQLDVSASDDACAVLASGAVVCWDRPDETPSMESGVSDAAEVALTSSQICVRRTSGEVACRLFGTSFAFVTVPGITNAVDLAAGFGYVCAALSDGTARCWGDNTYGTLGDGTTTGSTTPVTVVGVSGAVAIESGMRHVCARTSAGSIYCWGDNTYGQVGAGTTAMLRPTPSSIGAFSGALDVACGNLHTCVVEAAGTINCFGYNMDGQFGDGTTSTTPARSPGHRTTGVSDARALSAGDEHTCALRARGAYCFGATGLGDGSGIPSNVPVAVAPPP